MTTFRTLISKNRIAGRPMGARALVVPVVGIALLLGACAQDRNRGYTNYPDRWEYRQGPSDNYGRIYRY
jgi:hypothetical protein